MCLVLNSPGNLFYSIQVYEGKLDTRFSPPKVGLSLRSATKKVRIVSSRGGRTQNRMTKRSLISNENACEHSSVFAMLHWCWHVTKFLPFWTVPRHRRDTQEAKLKFDDGKSTRQLLLTACFTEISIVEYCQNQNEENKNVKHPWHNVKYPLQ